MANDRAKRLESTLREALGDGTRAPDLVDRGDAPGEAVDIIRAMLVGSTISLGCAVLSVLDPPPPAEVFSDLMRTFFEDGLAEVVRSQGLETGSAPAPVSTP